MSENIGQQTARNRSMVDLFLHEVQHEVSLFPPLTSFILVSLIMPEVKKFGIFGEYLPSISAHLFFFYALLACQSRVIK